MERSTEKHDETQPTSLRRAKGKPGIKPRWTSGAKTLVGTAASPASRIWYTVGNGVLNEIYFPDVTQANTRSIRFLVSDGVEFFSDEEWDAEHKIEWLQIGIPGCRIESRCKKGYYTIVKEIVTDPVRDTLMMRVQFTPSQTVSELKLYLFIEAHVGDQGADNDAWIGTYKGEHVLIATRGRACLAAALNPSPIRATCGYIGKSDGYTALSKHRPFPDSNIAIQGNIAMTAEVDYARNDGKFTISLACGRDPAEASQQARAGILQDFDKTHTSFTRQWKEKQGTYRDVADLSGQDLDMYRVSTAVLETHQSKRFPGGFVASLSLPWGFDRSDEDVGGYHVVWPRDLVETAMGKLASGDIESARSTLFYLSCTQDENGGWRQNMWLDGTPHWGAVQMDSMALPILLADKLRRDNALDGYSAESVVRGAFQFLLKHGPVTQQDRWETISGYSPYTMATEVAALLAAADFEEIAGRVATADFLRQTADAWNDSIDEFTYVEGTPLAEEHGVSGYYFRMAPPDRIERKDARSLMIKMPNLAVGSKHERAVNILSPDALALVRFGLRSADDPRILSTVKILDATLKRETTTGPVWVRSTRDGYGEKLDGGPFKKTGIGRGWPLLAGERAHFELASGNRDYALELLRTIGRQTSVCGMIPEQVWDSADIPEKFLFNGHPTGSGMPLVWAHSEYIKLLRSLHEDSVWDMPPQTVDRYQVQKKTAGFQLWTPRQKREWLKRGKNLRIDLDFPAMIQWTIGRNAWQIETIDSGLGIHYGILATGEAHARAKIHFKVVPLDVKRTAHTKQSSFAVQVM